MSIDDHATGVRQRWTPTLRQRLLERRRELLTRIARAEAGLQWLNANQVSKRQAATQEERLAQLLASVGQLERTEIADIDAALARIGTDHCGRCSSCAGAIDEARLEALPRASTCLGDAESREPGA